MQIELKLLSDTCATSGLGAFGGVDTDIAIDEYGLPIIPAKRLKGCLREEGIEIVSVLPQYEDVFFELFGKPGDAVSGSLRISNGELTDAEALKDEIKSKPYSPKQVTELFTSLRTGTAMKGTGIIRQTDDNTLRVTRVVEAMFASKENTFSFNVEKLDGEEFKFLDKCCRSLRGIGTNRTRGLGEIQCELIDGYNEERVSGEFTINNIDKAMFVHYTLTLTSPVIISALNGRLEECEESIPGSYMLGVFASAWTKTNKDCSEPHKDPDFRRLFLEGGVKFLSAYPASDENLSKTLYPSPRCIRTDKDGSRAIDCCAEDAPDEYSKTIKGFARNELHLSRVKKVVSAHHARPYDKAIGHALKNGSLSEGAFYSYDSLAEGQIFMGTIVGSESDLEIICKLARKHVHIGKSRTAQYGNAEFAWKEYSPLRPSIITINCGEKFRAVFRSPVVLTDKSGTASINPNVLAQMFGNYIEIEKVFCASKTIGGYNSKWLLPRTQVQALAAGSVIVFKNNGQSSIELFNEQFVGQRTNEGFGHISLEELPELAAVNIRPVTQKMASIAGSSSVLLENHIKKQKARAWIQRSVIIAAEKQGNVRKSQLGRLRTRLSRIDSFGELAAALSSETWKQDSDRYYIQVFCTDEDVRTDVIIEEVGIIEEKLRRKANTIHNNTYRELLREEEIFYWYKAYLIMLIRCVTKEKPEVDVL